MLAERANTIGSLNAIKIYIALLHSINDVIANTGCHLKRRKGGYKAFVIYNGVYMVSVLKVISEII
jgi:hypothetical protein